jgi:hypothetical protein
MVLSPYLATTRPTTNLTNDRIIKISSDQYLAISAMAKLPAWDYYHPGQKFRFATIVVKIRSD